MVKKLSANILRGRKCTFCGSYSTYRLADGRVKCGKCRKRYSLSKLAKDLEILHYFALEISANRTSKELNLSYKTVSSRYMFFRERIAEYEERTFRKLGGELELDETYFGGKRKGKRGRGALNKAIVFGVLERNGKVYSTVVPDVTAATLMKEIEEKTEKGSVFYTDCFKSYGSLRRYGKHSRVNHEKTFGRGRNHINGLEGFWSFAKERFHKYHGIDRENYPWYLKEMEFRYNHRNVDIFKKMFEIIYV
jgi:transposase